MPEQLSTGQLLSKLELTGTLNTDTISVDIQQIEGEQKPLQNTGILRDGGVSSVYDTDTVSQAQAGLTYITQTGVVVTTDSANDQVIANGVPYNIKGINKYSIRSRAVIPGQFFDVVPSSSGTLLGIALKGTVLWLYEVNATTFAVINAKSTGLTEGVSIRFNYASIVRTNTLAYSDASMGILIDSKTAINLYYTTNGWSSSNSQAVSFGAAGSCTVIPGDGSRYPVGYNVGSYYVFSLQTGSGTIKYGTIAGGFPTNIAGYYYIGLHYGLRSAASTIWLSAYGRNNSSTLSRIIKLDATGVTVYSNTPGAGVTNWTWSYSTPANPYVTPYGVAGTGAGTGTTNTLKTNMIHTCTPEGNYKAYTCISDQVLATVDAPPMYEIYGRIQITEGTPEAPFFALRSSTPGAIMGTYATAATNGINDIQAASNNMQNVAYSLTFESGQTTGTGGPGCFISDFGEYNPWGPTVFTNNSSPIYLTYKRTDGALVIAIINTALDTAATAKDYIFDEIGPGIIKFNCPTEFNILDTNKGKVFAGSSPFNAPIVSYLANSATTSSARLAISRTNQYGNFPDKGELPTAAYFRTTSLFAFYSMEMPYAIDFYKDGVYFSSFLPVDNQGIPNLNTALSTTYATFTTSIAANSFGENYFNATNGGQPNNFAAPAYSINPNVPISPGAKYTRDNNGAISLLSNTALQTRNYGNVAYYDGFLLQNFLAKKMNAVFIILGVQYGFDGTYIYQFQSGQTPTILCNAIGLQFMANSNSEAYFYSSYDNSIFLFNGGRDVKKIISLAQIGALSNALGTYGVYNIRDNELAFFTSTRVYYLRDGKITSNLLKTSPAPTDVRNTSNGIFFTGPNSGTGFYQAYSYFQISGTKIDPLIWQTPYYGFERDRRVKFAKFCFYFYVADGNPQSIKFTYYYQTESANGSETKTFTITPDTNKRCLVQYIPTVDAVLAASIQVEQTVNTASKITIYEAYAYYVPEAQVNNTQVAYP